MYYKICYTLKYNSNYKISLIHRYQVGLARPQAQTYRNLLTKLPNGSATLEDAYDAIDTKISEVRAYVDEWLRY